MPGLRESKKIKIRNEILKVSRQAFMENGYDNTSTKEIARRAGIGAGTLFNYFPTKAEILLEILSEEIDSDDIDNMLESIKGETAVDLIYNLVTKFISPVLAMPKGITKEFAIAFISLIKKRYSAAERMIDADLSVVEKLSSFISDLMEKGLINEEKDPAMLSRIIYSSLFFEIIIYLFDDRCPKENMLNNFKDSIDYLLK